MSLISVITFILSVYFQDLVLLISGRFLAGICVGVNTIMIPIYIKEMVPDVNNQKTDLSNLKPLYTKGK